MTKHILMETSDYNRALVVFNKSMQTMHDIEKQIIWEDVLYTRTELPSIQCVNHIFYHFHTHEMVSVVEHLYDGTYHAVNGNNKVIYDGREYGELVNAIVDCIFQQEPSHGN